MNKIDKVDLAVIVCLVLAIALIVWSATEHHGVTSAILGGSAPMESPVPTPKPISEVCRWAVGCNG